MYEKLTNKDQLKQYLKAKAELTVQREALGEEMYEFKLNQLNEEFKRKSLMWG